MKYLNILFYTIAEYYKKQEGIGHKASSILAVSLLLTINVMTFVYLIEYYNEIIIFKTDYHPLYNLFSNHILFCDKVLLYKKL